MFGFSTFFVGTCSISHFCFLPGTLFLLLSLLLLYMDKLRVGMCQIVLNLDN